MICRYCGYEMAFKVNQNFCANCGHKLIEDEEMQKIAITVEKGKKSERRPNITLKRKPIKRKNILRFPARIGDNKICSLQIRKCGEIEKLIFKREVPEIFIRENQKMKDKPIENEIEEKKNIKENVKESILKNISDSTENIKKETLENKTQEKKEINKNLEDEKILPPELEVMLGYVKAKAERKKEKNIKKTKAQKKQREEDKKKLEEEKKKIEENIKKREEEKIKKEQQKKQAKEEKIKEKIDAKKRKAEEEERKRIEEEQKKIETEKRKREEEKENRRKRREDIEGGRMMMCSYCGTSNSRLESFCYKCGKPLSSVEDIRKQMMPENDEKSEPYKFTHKKIFLAAGIFLIIVLILCVIIF